MDLSTVISKKKIIEISLFDETIFYSGVCVKATNSFWLIINYNLEKGMFDGFSVFRNSDIDYYSVYIKKTLSIKNNNLSDYLNLLPDINSVETFYSCISLFSCFKILAISLEKSIDSYYVGIFKKILPKELHIKIVNLDLSLGKLKKIKIEKIIYFSFYSTYEKKIANTLGNQI